MSGSSRNVLPQSPQLSLSQETKTFILLHHGSFLGLQDVVGEDPGHGHLNWELDPATHSELQEELPEPQLGEVTTLLQSLCMEEKTGSYKTRFYKKGAIQRTLRNYTLKLLFLLTTKIQQMGIKKGLAVKLLNVQDGWAFQTATQSLLRATFVSNERL